MSKIKQRLLLIPETSIEGFCYPFAENLLKKLKQLRDEGRIFKDEKESGNFRETTKIAEAVMKNLIKQIDYSSTEPDSVSISEIDILIKTSEEFLAIFQKK